MTYPDIPPGRAQTEPSPRDELAALRARVDELTRAGPPPAPLTPVCRVRLSTDVTGFPANTDVIAQDNWLIGEDPDGLATLSTAAGTTSRITIQRSGRYLVRTRAVFGAWAAATSFVAFVALNTAAASASVVRANGDTTISGADGAIIGESRDRLLNAGDVLYWGHWAGAGCTLHASLFNVPTEISLAWLGTR